MTTPTTLSPAESVIARRDRPGWIPPNVGDDWDPDPYAYQTEEEMMPAGIWHNTCMLILASMLMTYLPRRGLSLFFDAFLLYRDANGKKQRIAPDIVITTMQLEGKQQPPGGAYDLEMYPPPVCLIEVTSPKSNWKDYQQVRKLYASWDVAEYLIVDVVDRQGNQRAQTGLTLLRLNGTDYQEVTAAADGFLEMQTLGLRIRADGMRLVLQEGATGEFLHTPQEFQAELQEAERRQQEVEQRFQAEKMARLESEQRIQAERTARKEAERRLRELEEEMRRLRERD